MISATAFYARQMKKQTPFCVKQKEIADKTIKDFRKFGKENISAAEMEKRNARSCVRRSKIQHLRLQ